jgi:D-hydroxyproline dehydrogenase subunit alpha
MRDRFDILVVGAGPAGIAAAVTAAAAGERVGLVDDNPASGGQIWRSGTHLPSAAQHWLARLDRSSVVRLQGWRVFDSPQANLLCAELSRGAVTGESADDVELHFDKLILATGARECFLPFPGWTLPNVMGAGGLEALVRSGLPIAGKRVVVAGTGPLLLAVAAHLARCRAEIVAVCDQASWSQLARFAAHLASAPAKLRQGVGYGFDLWPTRLHTRCWPVAARGSDRLRAVTLRKGAKEWEVECDYLACGFHLVPNIELPALLGCRIEDGFVATDKLLETSVPGVYCAGEPTGIGGVELALLEGEIAALAASGQTEQARHLARKRKGKSAFVRALSKACVLDPALRALATDSTIVCRCEDVRCGALRPRTNWRDAKLHTRCGMGPCQGRICASAAEFIFGWRDTSFRPPIFPALLSSLASPETPADNLVAAGAPFNNAKEAR